MGEREIDYSRYRVAEAIAERWRAGESPEQIAADYSFDGEPSFVTPYAVELIVAAHDRKGKFEPS